MNAMLLPLTPTTDQRAKMAYVYIRQSSLMQVTRHAESTDLQYELVERAVALGWPRERVELIDEDLGKSGAHAEARGGFQRLLAEISLARVGLVLSFDASRLARNNRDWYQLLEVCSIFGTLIADGERLYQGVSPLFRMCIKIETGYLGKVVQAGVSRVRHVRVASSPAQPPASAPVSTPDRPRGAGWH
jgi:DNA invertase Pin-like site-specific DNA recombinase